MPRGRPSGNPKPSDREFEVMSALWSLGSGTVAEVREALSEDVEPAYTTVLTQLRSLEAKGWVRATLEGKAHRYVPAIPLEDARADAVHHMIRRLYQGSRDLFLTELVSDRRLTPRTLQRLKLLLERRLKDTSR